MAKDSGLAQTIYIVIGTVAGGLILAGLAYAYFANQLPLVIAVVIGLIVFAVVYPRWARTKTSRPTAEVILREGVPVRTRIVRPKKRLKLVVTVSLDTEVVPFDYRSESFEKGDMIEVEAESEEGAPFHFMVATDKQLRINKRRTVNFVFYEGKEFTTQFKKRFEIPASGEWHFIAYTPEGENYTTVSLTISKLE